MDRGRAIRHAIQKLPDTGMLTRPDLLLRSDREKRSLVEHGDTVSDAEGAGQLNEYRAPA